MAVCIICGLSCTKPEKPVGYKDAPSYPAAAVGGRVCNRCDKQFSRKAIPMRPRKWPHATPEEEDSNGQQ